MGRSTNVVAIGLNTKDVAVTRVAAGQYAVTDGSTGSGDLIPQVDNQGHVGTDAKRWALVRGTTVSSGAYLEEEVFDEESLDLPNMIKRLGEELEARTVEIGGEVYEGVRHFVKIAFMTSRLVLRQEERLRALEGRTS